jgi:hypothetical protein
MPCKNTYHNKLSKLEGIMTMNKMTSGINCSTISLDITKKLAKLEALLEILKLNLKGTANLS